MLRPTFLGFETQKRALFSAQKALDITGSNIGNVDTEGYTRQRVDLFSVENFQSGLRYNTKIALAGQGVDMRGVTQVRDVLLDERYRTLSGEANESTTKADILYQIEDVIDDIEAADTGFSGVMNKFEAALQSFSADNADRREMAAIAINEAKKVGQIFQNFSSRIDQVSELTFTKTENAVKRINEIFKQISALNKQIVDDYVASNETYIDDDGTYRSNTTYGPLELKDQRNLLLDELAEYGNVYVKENALGDITVSFGDKVMVDRVKEEYYVDENGTVVAPGTAGAKLVSQNQYVFGKISMFDPSSTDAAEKAPSNLKLYASELHSAEKWINIMSDPAKLDAELGALTETYTVTDAEGNPVVDTEGNPVTAQRVTNEIYIVGTDSRTPGNEGLKTGTLKGLFDMYNGNGDFVASPKYTGECKNGYQGIPYFKEIIDSLAKTMANKFNAANGYDGTAATADRIMFTYDENEPAFTFAVSDAWKNDTMMITRTPVQKNDAGKTGEELDNENLHRLLAVFQGEFTYDSIPSGQTYTLEGYVRNYGEIIGEKTQFEYDSAKANTTILESVGAARDEIMGVSLDEEGINMMNFQKWYNAAARMMTTLDEALDVIINQMGLVGR